MSYRVLVDPVDGSSARSNEPGRADEREEDESMNGVLILNGGGGMGDYYELIKRYAGGPDAPVVTIPTGVSNASSDAFAPGMQELKEHGFSNVSVLHTRERETADDDWFIGVLTESKAVLFHGGLTSPILDAYQGTKVQNEIVNLLERGGVVAGFSAGAAVAGSVVIDRPLYDVLGYRTGLGLIRNAIIDVHVIARNQHYDLTEARRAHPETVGIGIDVKTNVVIQDGYLTVCGSSYVVMSDTDPAGESTERLYFLQDQDLYDLEERRPLRRHWTTRPFVRARERSMSNAQWDSITT